MENATKIDIGIDAAKREEIAGGARQICEMRSPGQLPGG